MNWLGPAEWQALALSLKVAFFATLFALPLALICAHALARGRFRGRGLLNALIHLPLVLPPVVTGYALLLLFGRTGPLGAFLENTLGLVLAFNWKGAVLAAAIMGFPLMVRAIRLSLEAVDPKLEEAARVLGATRMQVWRRVTLPMILPGLSAGAILGFAKALGEFGATITFVATIPGQTRTVPSAIHAFLQLPGGEGPALKLDALSLVVALVAVGLSEILVRRGGDDAAKR